MAYTTLLTPSRVGLKALVFSVFAACVSLSGCQENVISECQDCLIAPSWFGSISEDCGWVGGTALFIRFDPDSATPDSSRKFQLHPIDMVLDSVKVGTVFADTLQVCNNAECEDKTVAIRILDLAFGSNQSFLGELEIGEENSDDVNRGYLILDKFPADFPIGCD